MEDFKSRARIIEGRRRIGILLLSAPHPSMDRLLSVCGAGSRDLRGKRYILRTWSGYADRPFNQNTELRRVETNISDPRIAATHALIHACWWTDLELAALIIQDLRGFIDINALIDNRNILEWALNPTRWNIDKTQQEDTYNICRYLIIAYGSKLNANRLDGYVLRTCIEKDYADVVAHIVTTYDPILADDASTVFKCLIKGGQDAAAQSYMGSHRYQLMQILTNILRHAAYYASTQMFVSILNAFRSVVMTDTANSVFSLLCETKVLDRDERIMAVLDVWAEQLDANTIETGLVNCWRRRIQDRTDSLIAQAIIERCIDRLRNRGIEIALALSNLELFDAILGRNLDQVNANPSLLRHALLECCCLDDVDTLAHILNMSNSWLAPLRSYVYSNALAFWCDRGDLEAITLLFDMDRECETLRDPFECVTTLSVSSALRSPSSLISSDRIPDVFVCACQRGDVELVELLIKVSGDSMTESTYRSGLAFACFAEHIDIIVSLGTHQRCHLDIRCNDDYKFDLRYVSPDIINLLNSIYDTTIDPNKGGKKGLIGTSIGSHSITYGNKYATYRLNHAATKAQLW